MTETKKFITKVEKELAGKTISAEMGIAVPFVNLAEANKLSKKLKIAAQNVHHEDNGAYTAEISVAMLTDLKIKYCITGHSERREYFGETDKMINMKNSKLIKAGITPIFCFGETEEQYVSKKTKTVVRKQLKAGLKKLTAKEVGTMIFAYEPI